MAVTVLADSSGCGVKSFYRKISAVATTVNSFGLKHNKKILKKTSTRHERRRILLQIDSKWHPLWKEMEGDHGSGSYISKLCKEGRLEDAVLVLKQMDQEGQWTDLKVYATVLQVCIKHKALVLGKVVHGLIIKSGLEHDDYLGAHLVGLYAKCGSLTTAKRIFDNISNPRDASWSKMVVGYAAHGKYKKALRLFRDMQRQGVEPNEFTFFGVLKACGKLSALEEGRRVHTLICGSRFSSHLLIQNNLIDMYAKCGALDDAVRVFEKMKRRDLVSWNSMLMAYSNCGQGEKSIRIYEEMQHKGLELDRVTFLAILNACTSLTSLEQGKQVHAKIMETGLDSDVVVMNTLLHMYAECGSIENTYQLFSGMLRQDVVSFNVMIKAFAKKGFAGKAIHVFNQMLREGMRPNEVTYVALLSACSVLSDLKQGKHVHKLVESSGYLSNVRVSNALMDMYASCGSAADAQKMFNRMPVKDVVTWNTMIMGYAKNGKGMLALEVFEEMQTTDIEPNPGTLAGILKACSSLLSLEQAKWYHVLVLRSGFGSNLSLENALIKMYIQCGSLEHADDVFKKMQVRNIVSWNTMIEAYLKHGRVNVAQELTSQMKSEGLYPNTATLSLFDRFKEVALSDGSGTNQALLPCSVGW